MFRVDSYNNIKSTLTSPQLHPQVHLNVMGVMHPQEEGEILEAGMPQGQEGGEIGSPPQLPSPSGIVCNWSGHWWAVMLPEQLPSATCPIASLAQWYTGGRKEGKQASEAMGQLLCSTLPGHWAGPGQLVSKEATPPCPQLATGECLH